MYFTLNHPTGAPLPVLARSIPEVTRFHSPFEIGPEQLTRKVFPLEASGMNWRTPPVIGLPSRVTFPVVGIRLIPHPATPTRATSRAHPTPTRALANPRSMCVTCQGETARPGPYGPAAARPGKGLPVAQRVAVIRDTGVPPGGA